MKIAVDAMGGDFGLNSTVKACIMAINNDESLEIVMYGDIIKIKEHLNGFNNNRLSIVDLKDVIDMGEKDPFSAIKKFKNTSSLTKGLIDLDNNLFDAFVTSGPTQCVVLATHLFCKKMDGFERLCLSPFIPNVSGEYKMLLDVGANIDINSVNFLNMAYLSSSIYSILFSKENPSIGILNIGHEKCKGREIDKKNYLDLEKSNLNFIGNIEACDVLNSKSDIILADGFTGNICIKSIEGALLNGNKILKEEIKKSFFAKIGYLFMKKALKKYKKRLSVKEVGGALLLGSKKTIIKAHGSSDYYAFYNAIMLAKKIASSNIIEICDNKLKGINDEK